MYGVDAATGPGTRRQAGTIGARETGQAYETSTERRGIMYSKVDTDLGMLKVTLDADGIARATRCGLLVHRSPTLEGMNGWLRVHGGRTINVPTTPEQQASKPKGPTVEQLVEMAMPGWDERGWHGGGEQPCRSKIRRTPKRGNTYTGRKAHRMPYGPGRTW